MQKSVLAGVGKNRIQLSLFCLSLHKRVDGQTDKLDYFMIQGFHKHTKKINRVVLFYCCTLVRCHSTFKYKSVHKCLLSHIFHIYDPVYTPIKKKLGFPHVIEKERAYTHSCWELLQTRLDFESRAQKAKNDWNAQNQSTKNVVLRSASLTFPLRQSYHHEGL